MLKDQVVIITGASTGIGKELALQLDQLGCKVVLAARNEEQLNAVSAKITDSLVVPTDVTDEKACKNLIDRTIKHYGRLDVLVNNAGLSMTVLFEDITDLSLFHKIMRVNYFGSVYCTYYALPHIKKTKGQIVAVSSVTGKTGVPTRTAYAGSKHAMQGFFDSLRIELMGSGVNICVISPGYVQSEVRVRALGGDAQARGESHIDESGAMPTAECVRQIVDAIQKRKRDVIIASLRVKIGQFLKLVAPGMVDNIARKAIDSGKS